MIIVHIFYFLKLASCITLKLDSKVGSGFKFDYSYTITGLSEEHQNQKPMARVHPTRKSAKIHMSSSEDVPIISKSLEMFTIRSTKRHHKTKRKTTVNTALTTKFKRGTTKKHNSILRQGTNRKHHHKNHHKKPINGPLRTGFSSGESPPLLKPDKEFIYTHVSNTENENGRNEHNVILYNKSHYVNYKGNVIPRDYANLEKLWQELDSTHIVKEFDETFSPPWWMQWHKLPWRMDWHTPLPSVMINDTWELWNQPQKQSIAQSQTFDVTQWLGDIWSKVRHYNSPDDSGKHTRNRPSSHLRPKVKHNIGVPDYVYSYVNNTVDEKGESTQKIILYNKTHYLQYTGDVVPVDYEDLCRLWESLSAAKVFDDLFRPPWWMEWHKPPWWMEWHTPPPGLLRNDTWEIWNQPGMNPPGAPPAARNSFDITKWMGEIWSQVKNDPGQANSWQNSHRNPSKQQISMPLPVQTDYVYSYVNKTVDDKGQPGQKIILYNKTHYLQYKGDVVPKDYNGLCDLWASLSAATAFDDNFRPPWWMEWHKPPWWMEWHTPPPGMLRNDTWEIWNQPGMKPPCAPKRSFEINKWLRQLWDNVVTHDTDVGRKDNDLTFMLPQLRQDASIDVGKVNSPHKLNPHSIKDDKQINDFTKYIMNRTIRLFQNVRDRSPEHHWKKGIKRLETVFIDAYKEYLRSLQDQHIRSVGSRKVIFNAIDVSHRFVKRLVNSMMDDLDKKSLLRSGPTPGIFQKEINKELGDLLENACHRLDLCKSANFAQYILDILDILLKVDPEKFELAFNSLSVAIKNTLYSNYLDKESRDALNSKFNILKKQPYNHQRAIVIIVRKIIDSRNSPMAIEIGADPSNNVISATLNFQSIVNKLEEKVPDSDKNLGEWTKIRHDFNEWAKDRGHSVQDCMTRFVNSLRKCVERLDKESFDMIKKNAKKLIL